jgi:hypothetical protein
MPLSKNGSIYQLASIIVDEGGEEVALSLEEQGLTTF